MIIAKMLMPQNTGSPSLFVDKTLLVKKLLIFLLKTKNKEQIPEQCVDCDCSHDYGNYTTIQEFFKVLLLIFTETTILKLS